MLRGRFKSLLQDRRCRAVNDLAHSNRSRTAHSSIVRPDRHYVTYPVCWATSTYMARIVRKMDG